MNQTQFNDLWPAAAHESWLCREAFHRFQLEGQRQINAEAFGLKPTRENNIAAYSAYADFIQHLHGTYMALFAMEVHHGPTPKPSAQLTPNGFVTNEADRLLKRKILDFGQNIPADYNISVPPDFAEDLRNVRNRTNHVSHERIDPAAAGRLTLQEFYLKYHHPLVEVLYLQIASGYLDRHAAGGKWDAIDGFSVLAGEAAQRPFGLETHIAQVGHFITTGVSHIRLGFIDESSADLPVLESRAPSELGYVLPVYGVPPWDPDEVWPRSFVQAWEKERFGGSLLNRLGKVKFLHGPQRPPSIVALSGSGLEETRYALRLADPKATPEAIATYRSDMDQCVHEAGEGWCAHLDELHLRLVRDQERRIAERDRVRNANKSAMETTAPKV